MAQISNALSQIFSSVEHLTLVHDDHGRSSEEHNEGRPQRVAQTSWVIQQCEDPLDPSDGLVGELSRCLRLEDGEHPLDLLPELQELTYPEIDNTNNAFTSFIDTRQNAGRPVTLIKS